MRFVATAGALSSQCAVMASMGSRRVHRDEASVGSSRRLAERPTGTGRGVRSRCVHGRYVPALPPICVRGNTLRFRLHIVTFGNT